MKVGGMCVFIALESRGMFVFIAIKCGGVFVFIALKPCEKGLVVSV